MIKVKISENQIGNLSAQIIKPGGTITICVRGLPSKEKQWGLMQMVEALSGI